MDYVASSLVRSEGMSLVFEQSFSYLVGILMAVAVAYPSSFMDTERERRFFTVVLAVVVLGFFGFPLTQGDALGLAWELAAVVVLGALLLLSSKRVVLLPLAWFGHGLWDLVFLLGATPIDKPIWVCELCVPFDWLIGAYLLTRLGRWRADPVSA